MGHGHESQSKTTSAVLPLLAVAAVAYGLGMATRANGEFAPTPRPVAGPGYTEPLPALGRADAPIVITEVIDFDCPYCANRNGLMKRLRSEYKDEVRIVVRHLPLMMLHPRSESAAVASMAANRQGKFFEYADRLYLHQKGQRTQEDYVGYAEEVGLDVARFQADLQDPALLAYVRKDAAAAQELNVGGTPSMYVNGTPVPPNAAPDVIREVVRAELDRVRTFGRQGLTALQARHAAAAAGQCTSDAPACSKGETFARLYIDNDVRDLPVDLRQGAPGMRGGGNALMSDPDEPVAEP